MYRWIFVQIQYSKFYITFDIDIFAVDLHFHRSGALTRSIRGQSAAVSDRIELSLEGRREDMKRIRVRKEGRTECTTHQLQICQSLFRSLFRILSSFH